MLLAPQNVPANPPPLLDCINTTIIKNTAAIEANKTKMLYITLLLVSNFQINFL